MSKNEMMFPVQIVYVRNDENSCQIQFEGAFCGILGAISDLIEDIARRAEVDAIDVAQSIIDAMRYADLMENGTPIDVISKVLGLDIDLVERLKEREVEHDTN